MDIDARGFNRMIRALQKKTAASYRDVIRGVTTEVLTKTTRSTKIMSKKKIEKEVVGILKRGMKLKNGDRIGMGKDGKIWFSGKGWRDKKNNWILVSSNGQLESPGDKVWRTKKGAMVSRAKLSARNKAQINSAINQAKKRLKRELKYLEETRGLGRASFIHLMKILRLKIPGGAKIEEVSKVVIPAAVKRALSAVESGQGNKFIITLSSKVNAALNKKAKGLIGFKRAINNTSKQFQRNLEKDFDKYAKKFAKRHGFTVK